MEPPFSKTFCYAPFTNLEILPGGSILPCCKFVDRYYDTQYNFATHSAEEYLKSEKLAVVKQELLDGKWPLGCERCRIDEEHNIRSRRQLDYDRWQHHYDAYDIASEELITLSLAITATCNLKCIICRPTASSAWKKEYKDLYGTQFPIIEEPRKKLISKFTDFAPNLVHLAIHGGEPLLSNKKEHGDLLDFYIESGQSKNISIHYTTNGTIWPQEEWLERWRHFEEIDFQISIDGIGDRFEYLRYPAKWDGIVNNVKGFIAHEKANANFRLSVAHTVSGFNVYYIDEFVTWCNDIGLPKPWLSKLHNPNHLRPTVWPNTAKQCIIEKLLTSQWPEVRNWANLMAGNDDSDQFEEFKNYMIRHDKYRKISYQQLFPELKAYL